MQDQHINKTTRYFFVKEYSASLILLMSVLIAMVWVNSPWKNIYHHIWDTHFAISLNGKSLDQPLLHWINDGLMAIFFFVIGLELKREFMAGELSTFKKASLPMIAALGGMIMPALIYFLINKNLSSVRGWGIPMATDIAFAIGLLSLAGKNVPLSLKIFLTALAVVDDLGAVFVIAFFYSSNISFLNLAIALVFVILLISGNLAGIRGILFYLIVGFLGVWLTFLLSGIHATIAGILVAFTIPARTKINENVYLRRIKQLTNEFEKEVPLNSSLTTHEQHIIIEKIKKVSQDAETPLQKLEFLLKPWVSFLIMPIFALANSGIIINSNFTNEIQNPISVGIGIGLVIGKFFGIFLFTWLAVFFKISSLPQEINWFHIAGVALIAGVGFTMSLFITELAFDDVEMIRKAKYGILLASVTAGNLGVILLRRIKTTR